MDHQIHQETLFNAGVDTALQISKLAKQAEMFGSVEDYQSQYLKFESMEMWMSPKFRDKKDSQEELIKIKKHYLVVWKKYVNKVEKDRKISKALAQDIKEYLTKYGKCLMYWRDKFGYGMPLKDDSRYALG